ncbi:MAG TPA: thioredoxin domain-containing protein [Candidatus Acidoferrales bacterium]|nr:thioredoxin domain-containing protein [Candidatus Acidoferrales bacterium]
MNRLLFRSFALLCAAGTVLFGVAMSAQPNAAQNSHSSADWARLSAAKSLGNPNAPIKVEVFSDYECPACGRFYEGTLRPMIDDYVASGKVYLVHRDFPLPLHKYSREAARWANAAARIGHFEAVDRVLYDNQAVWGEHGSADGDIRKFVQAALPPAEFKRAERLMQGCESDSHAEIAGCAVDAEIQHDMAAAQLVPVTQTPTFIVSARGQSYPPAAGVISWPLMKQFLDQILNQR